MRNKCQFLIYSFITNFSKTRILVIFFQTSPQNYKVSKTPCDTSEVYSSVNLMCQSLNMKKCPQMTFRRKKQIC